MNTLIIFIKNPIKGKVKTRLANTVGDDKALAIYSQLLERTRKITQNIDCKKYLFYSDFVDEQDDWDNSTFIKCLQKGVDLGERMLNAFKLVFEQNNNSKAIIIGSDCAALTDKIVEKGFLALQEKDFVIGPSNDGGYYLLGMNFLFETLFNNKVWSTESVLEDTENDIKMAGHTFEKLEALTDIDLEEDLIELEHLNS